MQPVQKVSPENENADLNDNTTVTLSSTVMILAHHLDFTTSRRDLDSKACIINWVNVLHESFNIQMRVQQITINSLPEGRLRGLWGSCSAPPSAGEVGGGGWHTEHISSFLYLMMIPKKWSVSMGGPHLAIIIEIHNS